eukprot:scaffold1084_cov114-Isochrysis_galbana.AAC.13
MAPGRATRRGEERRRPSLGRWMDLAHPVGERLPTVRLWGPDRSPSPASGQPRLGWMDGCEQRSSRASLAPPPVSFM